MITLYTRENNVISPQLWDSSQPYPQNVLWADLENTSAEEDVAFQLASGIDLPRQDDDLRNSMFNRLYKIDIVSHMTAAVISKSNSPYPETRSITFILTETTLLTLREIAPTSFKMFSRRIIENPRDFNSSPEVLSGLLEEIVLRVAHNSSLVVQELDDLSHKIFAPHGTLENSKNITSSMHHILQRLGAVADLNGKINESLHSLIRLLSFFREDQDDNHYLCRKIDIITSDAREILYQTGFISDKITFQMDATLGMIDVEQNVIMKILSVFTVIIMPPTLIGSIYGMNFKYMPELNHIWGYPVALFIMTVCAAGPYIYFRKKKWL